jgi:hypothetical protein
MQNKCKKCSYTWYPRGKNLSMKCPSCGSAEVGFAGGGVVLAGLIVAGFVLFGGGKQTQPTIPPEPSQTAASSSSADDGASVSQANRPLVDAGEQSETDIASVDAGPTNRLNADRPSSAALEATATNETKSPCKVDRGATDGAKVVSPNTVSADVKCQTENSVRNELF